MTDHKHLAIEACGDVTVVRFRESWINDFFQITELGQELYALVACEKHRKLVLDLSNVEFISSAVLGKLISLNSRVTAHGGSLVLCGLKSQIREVLFTCKLDSLFQIKSSLSEAVPAPSS